MEHVFIANDEQHLGIIRTIMTEKQLEGNVADTDHTFRMSESYATIIHETAKDRIAAYHNWIAGAVERGDFDYAKKLVGDLRLHQDIFAAFNMQAKHEIAEHTKKPLETEHRVYRRR